MNSRALHSLLAVAIGLFFALMPISLAGVALFAVGGLLITLARPWLGLAWMLLAAPWGALENVVLGGAVLDSGQILFLLVVALWLARSFWRRRLVIPHTPLNLPLALFLFASTLSLLNAPSLLLGLKELLKWVEIALIMWIVVDWAGSDGNWSANGRSALGARHSSLVTARSPLVLLLFGGLTQALIGIWQFGLRGTGPEHFLILDRYYRAYGTFEQPNPFGGFMSWIAAVAAGALAGVVASHWHQSGGHPFRFLRCLFAGRDTLIPVLFFALCAVAATLALLLSWSRGSWLGFAAAAAVLLFFWPRRRRQGVLLLLAVAILFVGAWQAGLAPAPLQDRLVSFLDDLRFGDVRGADINDANYAVLERLAHWQAAVDMARDHLWRGVGFGNYEAAYPDYALLNWPFALGHAHNYYLNLMAEVGLLGTIAYLLIWAVVFWQTISLLRLDWPRRGIALGLLGAWTALSVHQLLDKLFVNNLYLYLGVMFGILQLLALNRLREGSG